MVLGYGRSDPTVAPGFHYARVDTAISPTDDDLISNNDQYDAIADRPPYSILTFPNLAIGAHTVEQRFHGDSTGMRFEQRSLAVISMELAGGAAPQTLTPSPVTMPLAVPAPTLSFGGITLSPDPVAITMQAPATSVVLGALTLSPSHVVMPLVVPDPALTFGGLTVGPRPVT